MAKATKKDEKTVKVLIDKKSLLAAAKDINKADIADPAINLDDDEAGLKKALLAAAEIIEPEDPLKKETFLLLKQLQEEKPEDSEDDESNDPEEDALEEDHFEDDEDDEKSLEDLTVQELQAKCKAAGLPFKEKKTTKAQLIAMLEANAEKPEPEEEPEEEPVPVKKAEKSKPEKRNASKADPTKSNKGKIWAAWKNGKGETDISKLSKITPDIKENTIKGWLKAWEKGNNLPAAAKL